MSIIGDDTFLENIKYMSDETLMKAYNIIKKKFRDDKKGCKYCEDPKGFFMGVVCHKCNRPFRSPINQG